MGTEDIEKMICDKCNGEGTVYSRIEEFDPLIDEDEYIASICPKCHGHKKLDWIENILGKEIPKFTEKDFFRQEYPIGNKVVGKGEVSNE